MKKMTAISLILFSMFLTIPAAAQDVVAVGKAVGIDVRCSGLLVVGFSEESPARDSGMHCGDLIVAVDGETVEQPEALRDRIQNKQQVTVTAMRQSREQSFLIRPQVEQGTSLIGANVKSEMAGIGTVTYYDPATGMFGALGHGIAESSSEKLFPVRDGFICKATIVSVDKGRVGSPGMLQGAFDGACTLGTIQKNTPCGVFGTMFQQPSGETVTVGERGEVQTGPAEVLCNVSGEEIQRFQVNIVRLYPMETGTGRNMMLEVTDPRLIEATGGIVQGMSGSPILQNGKLVGAVTHVLISDPEIGYGIFIEEMLDAAG